MAQITVRVPDELLEEIDDATGPETSRSEWLRNAARARLAKGQDGIEDRIDEIESRLERVEEHQRRPVWRRLFASRR